MRAQRLCLLVVLFYASAWRVATIDRPFDYDDEATGASNGVFARNYLAFGLNGTHGIPVLTAGDPPPGTPLAYYPSHPPLVPLLISASYLLFGFGDWQTRLPSALASVGAVLMLYLLVQRVSALSAATVDKHSRRAGLFAAAIYAALPMNLYFGGMPEVLGSPFVLFSVMAVDAYLLFHDRHASRRWWWLVATFTLAALSDWPAFFLVPVFLIHFVATRPRGSWGWIIAFCAAACGLFAALYVYIAVAAQLSWTWMVPLVLNRSAIKTASQFSAREWWSTALTFNRHLHTVPVIVLSGAWLVTTMTGRLKADPTLFKPSPAPAQSSTTIVGAAFRRPASHRVAAILMAWGLLHVAVGRQGVFNHEWWWWPLTPGLAVTAALLVESAIAGLERRWALLVNAGATCAIAAFAIWTSTTTFRELFPTPAPRGFTTRDLGRAIRAAAPGRSDVALLVWSGFDPQIWFYGDRAVRANVWSVADLDRRLRDPTADLLFGFDQPWTGPATGLVFPLELRDDFKDLRARLRERYRIAPAPPEVEAAFEIYDLREVTPP